MMLLMSERMAKQQVDERELQWRKEREEKDDRLRQTIHSSASCYHLISVSVLRDNILDIFSLSTFADKVSLFFY
jgi:hypothetical protein